MTVDRRCKTCRFWQIKPTTEGDEAETGDCVAISRPIALRPRFTIGDYSPTFPETGANHWCSEWQARQ